MCPNGRKKSHCMLVRRAACSQLCLGVKIGRNVHTTRFKGRKCSYRPLQRAKCSYRPKLNCPGLTTHSHATRLFPPIWTQNVVCTSSDMVAMWLVWIPPSLRSGGYTSHSSQSPPCRPWYTIYYFVIFNSFFYFTRRKWLRPCGSVWCHQKVQRISAFFEKFVEIIIVLIKQAYIINDSIPYLRALKNYRDVLFNENCTFNQFTTGYRWCKYSNPECYILYEHHRFTV